MFLPEENLLEINLGKLEEECQGQAKLSWQCGQELVAARKEVKLAKNRLKLWSAELNINARQCPADYGLEKVTEGAIESLILTSSRYQILQEELTKAEEREDLLDIFHKAICFDRREALTNLCDLHGQTYWSRPDTSGDSKKRQDVTKSVNKGTKIK